MYQILFYNKSMNDCRTHTMAIIESTPEYGGIINTMSKFKKMMSTTLAGCMAASALMMSAGALNSGYSEGEKLITYPIPFKELLGFASGLVDTSATFVEHASVNPNNSNARVFLHALMATNVEITTWIWLVGI